MQPISRSRALLQVLSGLVFLLVSFQGMLHAHPFGAACGGFTAAKSSSGESHEQSCLICWHRLNANSIEHSSPHLIWAPEIRYAQAASFAADQFDLVTCTFLPDLAPRAPPAALL